MPKFLSEIMPGGAISTSPEIVKTRPVLAVYIAQMVSIGALIEQAWAMVLTEIAHLEPMTALAVIETLKNGDFQKKFLKTMADRNLDPSYLDLVKRVMKAVDRSADTRNAFCHQVWGECPELSDALVLIKPTAFARFSGTIKSAFSPYGRNPKDPRDPPNLSDEALVYFEEDFLDAIDNYLKALNAVHSLNLALSQRNSSDPWWTETALQKFEEVMSLIEKK